MDELSKFTAYVYFVQKDGEHIFLTITWILFGIFWALMP
jgi:hypothetical protein